jgi:hypothetical protein
MTIMVTKSRLPNTAERIDKPCILRLITPLTGVCGQNATKSMAGKLKFSRAAV